MCRPDGRFFSWITLRTAMNTDLKAPRDLPLLTRWVLDCVDYRSSGRPH